MGVTIDGSAPLSSLLSLSFPSKVYFRLYYLIVHLSPRSQCNNRICMLLPVRLRIGQGLARQLPFIPLTKVIGQLPHLHLQLGDCLGVHHGGILNVID